VAGKAIGVARTKPHHRERGFPSNSRLRSFQARLLAWFTTHGRSFYWREPHATQYELIVAELLLQRTRAEAVAARLPVFLAAIPSWESMRDSRKGELEELLRPLGLWQRRASSMRELASVLAEANGRVPLTREGIDALPGVGQYIANAISVFIFGDRAPLLDVNMARVLERHFGPRTKADIRYDPWLQHLSHAVVNCNDCPRVNWAILDLAAKVCLAAPRCAECPLSRTCLHAGQVRKQASLVPSRGKKRAH
jgi:A/G-specific adenine glycosylase